MTDAPLILVVEDNERNLKLVRDVLEHHGFRDARGRATARTASRWRASTSRSDPDGRPAAGHRRRRGACAGCARIPRPRRIPCRRGDGVRDEGRPRAAARRRLRRLPGEADRRARASRADRGAAGRRSGGAGDRRRHDPRRRRSAAERAPARGRAGPARLRRASPATSGEEALDACARADRPRAARRRDARRWTATRSAGACAPTRRRRSCRWS